MYSMTLIDEVMAQPFYPPEDEVNFDSQSKRDVLSIPHAMQNDNQQELVDRSLGCLNTSPEVGTKSRSSTRRRIQVACLRCRKRKIKCSGDGDGQGCSNCRSAGNTHCQFLRVNSSILQTKAVVHSGSGWPYPPNEMVSHSPRLGLYALSMAPKMGVLPGNSPNPRVPSFPRVPPDYDMTAATPDAQNPYGRQQSFHVDQSINYEDESSTSYSVPSSAYLLPSSPQNLGADYWTPKGWGAAARHQNGKASSETIFSDSNETENNSLVSSAYSYVYSSGQGPQPSEIAGVTSPAPGERTLPNPTGRNAFPVNMDSLPTAATPMPVSGVSSVSALDCKPVTNAGTGSRWTQRSESRTPMQSTPTMSFSTTGPVNRAKLMTSSGQDMMFSCLPMGSSSTPSPLVPTSGAYTGLEAAGTGAATDSSDGLRGNGGTPETGLRNLSRENTRMLSLTECTSDTYGYTKERNYRNRSAAANSSSASTLVNGFPYRRPKHTDTLPQMNMAALSADGFSDFRAHVDILHTHTHTPISALSNPGGL